MKASELNKEEESIENIYSLIQDSNNSGSYRIMILWYKYISPITISKLLNDGFKCYQVIDYMGLTNWIIEW